MKKPQPIPDDIDEVRGVHTFGSWHPSVSVNGKEIEAKVTWLSKMERSMTLREILELYPGNPSLSHAEGGSAWAFEDLDIFTKNHLNIKSTFDMTIRNYLEGHGDRVLRVTLNLSGLGIRSIDEIEGLDTIPRIDELNLSDNQLGDNDLTAISQMPFTNTLQIAFLRQNRLTFFPTCSFPMLWELNLGENMISRISAIEPSISLESLILTKNRLKRVICDDIARFPNLINLSVNNNEISEIGDITGFKFGSWRSKSVPYGMTVQRQLRSGIQFSFSFYDNPIVKIHPHTIVLLEGGQRDGTIESSYEVYRNGLSPA